MSLVQVHEIDRRAELVLYREDKHNALSTQLVAELMKEIGVLAAKASKGEVLSLIIRSSSSKAFCAGADLTERLSMSDEAVVKTLDALGELMKAVADFPVATMAVIEGVAFGGGLELALACDLRFALPTAKLGLTETKLGIIPGAGGTQRLSRLIGIARAKELIFSARRIEASDPRFLLCNYVGEQPLEMARAFAEEVSQVGPVALQAAKAAIDEGASLTLAQGLECERVQYLKTLKTEDRREALRAFVEKREAVFRGK